MAYGSHATNIRVSKVSKIFSKFDINKDEHLSREEMAALVVAVNPKVAFGEEQIAAILDEVFRTYGDYIDGDEGLSFDGLLQTYHDGAGDIDRDFNSLGLDLDKESEVPTTLGLNGNAVDVVSSAKENPKRKEAVRSWAESPPKNGVVYDSTCELMEELELQIRDLKAKMDKRKEGGTPGSDLCIVSVGWARNMGSADGSDASQVVIGRRPWEDLGLDYLQFQRKLAEIRKKADQLPSQDKAFDVLMATGKTLFNHRLYKDALLSFKRAGEVRPADVMPHFQRGNTHYVLGKLSEAREAYALALNAGADEERWGSLLPQIHINLGIVLESEGMLMGASEHYKEAATREPKHYRALKLLGSALYGVGEYKAAKEALLQAISLNADYADAHCELGSVLHALGDHEQAIREFERVLVLRSDHTEALYNLATLLKDIGQYGRAASTYQKVLALQPNHWRAQLNGAVSLLGAGDIDESKRAFKEAYKMTGRSELYDAILHLQHMEKRPQGMSSFLRRGDANSGVIGDSFRAEDNFRVVESARFRRANMNTTPRERLAFAIDIRQFQRCTRFERCDVANVMNQTLLNVSSLHDGTSEKMITKEALEKIIRRLLHFLKPEAYQLAMKMVNEKVLAVLDVTRSGRVDLGMVLAVLAPVCRGSLDSRKRAAFHALVFRSSRILDGEISKQDAQQYLKVVRAAYLPPSEGDSSEVKPFGNEGVTNLSFPGFVEMLDDDDCGFGILNVVGKLEAEDHMRHGRQACSVCCYPILGPRFKETKLNFSLCSLCYSCGKVPSVAKHEEVYYFKEVNSELGAFKDKLQGFKSSFKGCRAVQR